MVGLAFVVAESGNAHPPACLRPASRSDRPCGFHVGLHAPYRTSRRLADDPQPVGCLRRPNTGPTLTSVYANEPEASGTRSTGCIVVHAWGSGTGPSVSASARTIALWFTGHAELTALPARAPVRQAACRLLVRLARLWFRGHAAGPQPPCVVREAPVCGLSPLLVRAVPVPRSLPLLSTRHRPTGDPYLASPQKILKPVGHRRPRHLTSPLHGYLTTLGSPLGTPRPSRRPIGQSACLPPPRTPASAPLSPESA